MPFDMHLMQALDHLVLAVLDVLHADCHRIELESEFRAAPGQRSDFR